MDELSRLEHIFMGREEPGRLEFSLLWDITDKFSVVRIIGEGGCGIVYKGVLRNGMVAVKKLFSAHTIDEKMFDSEVHSMLMVKHKNIVRFLGYCSDTQGESREIGGVRFMSEIRERLLCFEYINKGSLRNCIKDELRGLEWHERYEIIEGICEGLDYLHRVKRIRHMDLKPENILLDDHMVPKIADFGLARLDEKSHTTSKQRLITPGYCAPEYYYQGKMSAKSDIYSLGVIILELVTGSKEDPDTIKVLRRWKHRWNKSSEHTPFLWYRQVTKCIDLAQWCKQKNPIGRPNIWDIIRDLNDIDSWNGKIRYAAVSSFDEILPSLEDMLGIEPLDIHIPFALCEQTISFSIKMTNDTNDYFAFRIATTSLLPFTTQPEKGIVPPRSMLCATITLEPQDKALLENHCNEEFSVQTSRLDGIPVAMDVSRDMFNAKVGKKIDEVNLAIVFEMPPTPEGPQTDESQGSLSQVVEALAQAGLESSNLIIGIDFTKSNEWTGKNSFGGMSLHHIGDTPNPYEQAISIIGRTLSAFDEDNLIPCYGFGDASTHDQDVFAFYPDEKPCNGFQEALARYREIVPHLRLSGPTSFAPIIETATTIVEKSGGQYHVLVIIADGQVTRSVDTEFGQLSTQEQMTVDAIVQASEFPLSIILVGVGDGPWDMMKEFDDNIPARSFDNFQFVNFTSIMSKKICQSKKETEFALSSLMEIPLQYKATLELGILGRCLAKSPERVPLPPPFATYSAISRAPPSRSNSYRRVPSRPREEPTVDSTITASITSPPTADTRASELQMCPVCLFKPRDMAFGCGHQTCSDCGPQVEDCPICRRPIDTRVKLY